MAFFGFINGCPHGPYKDKSRNLMYNVLFCDTIELYSNNNNPEIYPWNIILSKNPNSTDLQKIIIDNNIESCVKILAYNQLKSKGISINKKELLGVIIEVGSDKGLDVLAAYKDGTARYINQSVKIIVRDERDTTSDFIIKELFNHSENVINNIEPWDKERLPYPEKGMARLTFLVSDELYFGQGPVGVLLEDKMGKPVFQSGTKLVRYLTEKVV